MSEDYKQEALAYHAQPTPGKLAVTVTKPTATQRDLALAYTPGVAEPVRAIHAQREAAYQYTSKGNLVAVITDGSAVLGLGNMGALAAKPVMEGKGVLFKHFAGIDVFDIEVDTQDPDEFVDTVARIAPGFGGINLEDIAAPRCFEIERRLIERLDIPVFHDDQHGTAIIVAAGLMNALELQSKHLDQARIVFIGAGAAAIATGDLLISLGAHADHILMADLKGILHTGRNELEPNKARFSRDTDCRTLADACHGADVVIGLSGPGAITPEMLQTLAPRPIVFALANPDPEIMPSDAYATRDDLIMATGRSDFPNQVNNVLGFPFIFRGALDARASIINREMHSAAVHALASLAREAVPPAVLTAYGVDHLAFGPNYIIPTPFDPRLIDTVPPAVAAAAVRTGVAPGTGRA